MYLQRLEIQGFKSFAKKTVFEFPKASHRGAEIRSITGIVGPNGSGKSNVADAIRWVLGESSLKVIRCKKADDAIFNGSETKARQGFAEVALYLNNEDRELPIDFTEVCLTRRVFRDGETEYFINKSRVRLFDILMLLAKANFGQRTYSIVGQGMVDHIINISPFERKEFFDEATGVKQYQIKREQAVNRLRRSRENLGQTNQILQELEPRLRLLSRQVKRLEKKQQFEVELKELQKKYYGRIWTEIQGKKTEFNSQYEIKKGAYDTWMEKMQAVRVRQSEHSKEESRKEIFNNLQKDHNKLVAEKNEILKDLAILKGKMSLEYVKAGKQNLSWLQDKKEQAENRLAEIQESLNNQTLKLEEHRKTLAEKDEKTIKIQEEITSLNNALTKTESLIFERKTEKQNTEGARQAIQALMRQKDRLPGLIGPIYELCRIDKQYEKAVAGALGANNEAVVVRNLETAIKGIEYLKENKLGSVIFIPLNKIKGKKINSEDQELLKVPGAICFAAEQIKTDESLMKIFRNLLGTTVIVDGLNAARSFMKIGSASVTLDGDIAKKSGIVKGGFQKENAKFTRQTGGSSEDLMKEAEIYKTKLQESQLEYNRLQKETNELRVEIQVNETKVKGLQSDQADLNKEKRNLMEEIEANNVNPKDTDKYLRQLQLKQQEFERQLENLNNIVLEKRKEIDHFNIEEEKKRAELFRLQEETQEIQEKISAESNKIHEIKIEIARLETRQEDLLSELRIELGSEFDIAKFTVSDSEDVNMNFLQEEISRLKKNLDMVGGIDTEISAEHAEVDSRFKFLSEQAADLEKGINDLEKVVAELDKIINDQFDSSFKLINKAFSKYFVKIFGNGGKAKLELIQREEKSETVETQQQSSDRLTPEFIQGQPKEDILPEEKSTLLNTGIEIMVAPPNKKISNIAVLSGGERTMTSLALICAIIESNPAPFIVMDEVDAALDEANSMKFGDILRELSRKCQFVIITHNQVVMHSADVLYGVAMGGDGMSRVLSLNLEEAEKVAKK
ncbi:MAG: AAA family ATPase [Parcubacteria group bacterium]